MDSYLSTLGFNVNGRLAQQPLVHQLFRPAMGAHHLGCMRIAPSNRTVAPLM